MQTLRTFMVTLVSLVAVGCDPIPYARVELAPAPPALSRHGQPIDEMSARVLVRHGFVVRSAPCLGAGRGYRREVTDSTGQSSESVALNACVLLQGRDPHVWFNEERFATALAPSSAEIVHELADSLRLVARVRVRTR